MDADTLEVRSYVDKAYERIGRAMFSVLQSISKMDGIGLIDEDKGQLNHYVILIEHMYHIETRVKVRSWPTPALKRLVDHAHSIYMHSLAGYVQTVLRRPIGKMMDFSNGIDALLQSTPANEVTFHSAYSKSAMKKLVKEYTPKDQRKLIDGLAKRVQKHFTDDDDLPVGGGSSTQTMERDEVAEVLAQVWNAAEDGFAGEIERLARILKTCYSDTAQADFSPSEVRRLFRQAAPAVRRR